MNNIESTLLQDAIYAESEAYKQRLIALESAIQDTSATQAREEYISLIKRYGGNTPMSDRLEKTLSKHEKPAIMNPATQLDNFNSEETPCTKGETDMAKKRCKHEVTLPDGTTMWVTGVNQSEVVRNVVDLFTAKTSPSNAPLFEDMAQKWYALHWEAKENGIKNTWKNVHTYIFDNAIPYFKGKTIREIKRSDIQAYINHLRQNTNLHAKSSLEKALLYVKQVFDLAVKDDLLEKNPAGIKKDFDISGTEEKRNALNKEQVDEIIQGLQKIALKDALLVYIPLFTGVRKGEMLGFQWGDINWEKNTITVDRAIHFNNGKPRVGEPKSAAGYRTIPIRPELTAILEPLKGKDSDYILTGEAPMTESSFRRAWQRIEKAVNMHGATCHIFRHTYASFAARHWHVKQLQLVMGHSDMKTTLGTYVHIQEDQIPHLWDGVKNLYEGQKGTKEGTTLHRRKPLYRKGLKPVFEGQKGTKEGTKPQNLRKTS